MMTVQIGALSAKIRLEGAKSWGVAAAAADDDSVPEADITNIARQ